MDVAESPVQTRVCALLEGRTSGMYRTAVPPIPNIGSGHPTLCRSYAGLGKELQVIHEANPLCNTDSQPLRLKGVWPRSPVPKNRRI